MCPDGPLPTDDDLDFFHENGYWLSPRLIDEDQIAALRRAHDALFRAERDFDVCGFWGPLEPAGADSPGLRQCNNGWWFNAEIRKLVTSPLIGAIAARFLQTSEVRLWHDQVLWKPGLGPQGPSLEGNVGWHQDYRSWKASTTPRMLTVNVVLQDTDLALGAMQVIHGSHKWGLIEGKGGFSDPDLEKLKAQYLAEGHGWEPVTCKLGAGCASFHHSLTIHGSGPNLSAAPRLSIAIHLQSADCSYSGNWHSNVMGLGPNARVGQLFTGDWWPVLWRAGYPS